MDVTKMGHPRTSEGDSLPAASGVVAGVASLAAMFATYWDDAWHTDVGRDEFAIPPHVLLYGSVLVVSVAIVAWALRAWQRSGWGWTGLRALLAQPPLLLGAVGGAATLGSAPVDNYWHESYGRDAVLWSPPHLVAVTGTLVLATSVLAGLVRTTGRGTRLARLLNAAAVIAALQIPVLEYDTDVPQFSSGWFLPVAALGSCAALSLLTDLLSADGSLPTRTLVLAAAVFTAVRGLTAAGLVLLGHSAPFVPPVLGVFLVAVLLRRRSPGARLVAAGTAAPFMWWLSIQLQPHAVTNVELSQMAAAVALSSLAGAAVGLVHGDLRPSPAGLRTATTCLLLLAVVAIPAIAPTSAAWAHDPGQGEQVRQGQLTVQRAASGQASVTMRLGTPCQGLTARRTVARRSGTTLAGPLQVVDETTGCVLRGQVTGLNAGRWFVYVEVADTAHRRLEAWLPSKPGSTLTERRPLYSPPQASGGSTQVYAGGALLGLTALLLAASLRLARRTQARSLSSAS